MEPNHGVGRQAPQSRPTSGGGGQSRRLNGKDLVIRMLAEVFQVEQAEGGQVRWQQVSSSLVPVSLYSRTTQRWLDWLLAASDSSTNSHRVNFTQPANHQVSNSAAMSPDSRDFLLLLQQFHQRQQADQFGNGLVKQELQHEQQQPVVFQVVAHDFFEGQCRKILNVKLSQPGTRLGLASDYFVYWKEPQLQRRPPLQSSSSFNSNASVCYQQLLAQQHHQQQHLSPTCCLQAANNQSTWGLNFASVNDARLFYDICSLNSVDLNFNSDYLKQLQLRQQPSNLNNPSDTSTNIRQEQFLLFPCRQQQKEQRIIRDFLDYKQRQLQQTPGELKQEIASIKRQSQTSKCPACRRLVQQAACTDQQQQVSMKLECPLHSIAPSEAPHLKLRQEFTQSSLRARSRSSTRQARNDVRNEGGGKSSKRRLRSFSTPPSPEQATECPMHQHQQQHHHHHHPLCMSLVNQNQTTSEIQNSEKSQLKPKKPARGEMRDFAQQLQVSDEGYNLAQQARTAISTKAQSSSSRKYLGLNSGQNKEVLKQQSSDTTGTLFSSYNMCSRESCQSKEDKNNNFQQQFSAHEAQYNNEPEAPEQENSTQQDREASLKFAASRAAQRRSTGIDSGTNIDHFHNSLAHRNARLARAQYANSKNMKEFLSLDAGGNNGAAGIKSTTPTELTSLSTLNERLERPQMISGLTNGHQKAMKPPRGVNQRPCKSSLGGKIVGSGEQQKCSTTTTVATTTDDLPLDPQTKKRMFRLTSDEVISERTEPRSLSTPSGVNLDLGQFPSQKSSHETAAARQMRAVSLGPLEVETAGQGEVHEVHEARQAHEDQKRVARDEPYASRSRRRSLERSMCVDLQEPCTSSCRQQTILKPLIQSATAAAAPAPAPRKRARTKSSGATTSCCSAKLRPSLVVNGRLLGPDLVDWRQMLSFKSAPDVSRLAFGSHQEHCCQMHHQPAGGISTSKVASYAVPLCADELDDGIHEPYGRKSLSCPSSLKRRANLPQADAMESRQAIDLNQEWQACCFARQPPQIYCNCAYCSSERSMGANSNLAKHNYQPTATFGVGNKSLTHHHQQQQRLHCQQQQQCINNAPNESELELGATRTLATTNRPFSSQSSRSPLHYGLYESDCEDDDTCHSGRQPEVGPRWRQCPGFHRSSSVYLGCPAPDLDLAPKPVQGYDQTLARASLKSRQRARSQPPLASLTPEEATAEENENESLHLSRSVENVRKLIREVQKELDSLRAQPLSFNLRPSTGLDHSLGNSSSQNQLLHQHQHQHQHQCQHQHQLLKPSTGKGSSKLVDEPLQAGSSGAKMLQEERNQQASYQMPLGADHQRQLNYNGKPPSSATRPARHFKCVGAIRKAGFLSVKKWILKRRQSIELARKQGWKRYWVCLKGTALLFHSVIEDDDACAEDTKHCLELDHIDLESWISANCSSSHALGNNLHLPSSKQAKACYIEKEPRHLIIVEGAIAQPIPEHPKRDFVFCLSTTFGDAYLFQASCQLESDNWISAIHNACAASIARHLTRDEAIKLFETKIRHLELEAEKKLFLRQRLESRLTSMSSIGHLRPVGLDCSLNLEVEQLNSKRNTMRSLLHRLQQQLLALDIYIEQIHCEAYQLRCYLSSCAHQHLFYQALIQEELAASSNNQAGSSSSSIELPHPKSLLVHVSKATKLILIKLGVFTVSSFHAYVHARQSSAENNLVQTAKFFAQNKQILHTAPPELEQVELRVRSQSISEKLLNKTQNLELENDTEQLIHLSDLRRVPIKINRNLLNRIRTISNENKSQKLEQRDRDSDDRYSFQDDGGEQVFIHLKLHQSSSSIMIIKQLLQIIEPNLSEINCLDYYLQLSPMKVEENESSESECYVAKARETLGDWGQQFEYLELFEKIIFKVQLTRKRMDEDEAAPFGIAIGAQLFACDLDSISVLNVYCSYIEWGSVADKAGLRDDDELLMINGVSMMDLDMMFVECLIHDESQIKLVVRSSRADCPPGGQQLDKFTWRPPPPPPGNSDGGSASPDAGFNGRRLLQLATSGSQIISDEYLSSLVCPPPPSHSDAFLRPLDSSGGNLWRQKSDLTSGSSGAMKNESLNRLVSSATNPALAASNNCCELAKAKSQQQLLELSQIEDELEELVKSAESELCNGSKRVNYSDASDQQQSQETANDAFNGSDLACQLLEKTEQLSRLLGKTNWKALGEGVVDTSKQQQSPVLCGSDKPHQNQVLLERLKRSILELLETEYAYIKQLETVREQYLIPLEESNYLEIVDLRQLNQVVLQILLLQREFFYKLTSNISDKYEWSTATGSTKLDEDYEELNKIVERLDQFKSFNEFVPLLRSLKETFIEESVKFKIYSSYCVSYSKLQKFLHPKLRDSLNSASFNQQHLSVGHNQQQQQLALPSQLDTFLSSNNLVVPAGTNGNHHHKDFFKPLGSFRASPNSTSNENLTKLKQLNDFLANLDSSSSSASISLTAKSDLSQQLVAAVASCEQPKKISIKNHSSSSNNRGSFNGNNQKSVHQQNLESYLIKPIQRIVKYPMLLNSIAISVSQLSHQKSEANDVQVHSDLEAAVRQMGAITTLVNDTQRISDEYGQNFELIERQYLERQQVELAKLTGQHLTSLIQQQQQPTISLKIEHLLYFGQVDWLNIQEFNSKFKKQQQTNQANNLIHMLFVFESCVVLITKEQVIRPGSQAKKKPLTGAYGSSFAVPNKLNQHHTPNSEDVVDVIRYQTLIPVKEVQVRSVPLSSATTTNNQQLLLVPKRVPNKQQAINDAQSTYLWELFRCSSVNSNSNLLTKSARKRQASGKVYLLANLTNDIRNAFLRKIRFIIRESVRNMSLPPARSPSVKSLTPKKLSSPSSNTNSSCSQSTSLSPIGNSNDAGLVKEVDADDGCKLTTTTQHAVDGTYATSIEVNN